MQSLTWNVHFIQLFSLPLDDLIYINAVCMWIDVNIWANSVSTPFDYVHSSFTFLEFQRLPKSFSLFISNWCVILLPYFAILTRFRLQWVLWVFFTHQAFWVDSHSINDSLALPLCFTWTEKKKLIGVQKSTA